MRKSMKKRTRPTLAWIALCLGIVIALIGAVQLTVYLRGTVIQGEIVSLEGDDFRKDVSEQRFRAEIQYRDSKGQDKTAQYVYKGLSDYGYVPLVGDNISVRYTDLGVMTRVVPTSEDRRLHVSLFEMGTGVVVAVLAVAVMRRQAV